MEKKRGNTVYVHGYGLTDDLCRKAFQAFGKFTNISVDTKKK